MTQEVKDTARGMVIWSVVFSAVGLIIALILLGCFSGWQRIHTEVLLGVIAGAGLAVFMAVHMALALSASVEMDEDAALIHTKKKYIIRTTIILVCITGLYFTGWFNILGMLGGLFSLKPATYMQILFQKDDQKNICDKEEEA